MLHNIFVYFDAAVGAFSTPIFMRSKGEALRWFEQMVNNPETIFSKSPKDYTLLHLGEFDDVTCVFSLSPAPVALGVALEFVKSVD